MSLKNKIVSAFTLAIGIAVFSTLTFAQDTKTTTTAPEKVERTKRGDGHFKGENGDRKFGREGRMRRQGMMRMMHDLNLTDAQKAQIKSIRESNKPDEATRTEMRTIFESRKAGTELTAEQKDRLKALREQGRAKAQSIHEQIMGVLTAEQKAQMETRKLQMKQRMEEHRKMRQDRKAPIRPLTPTTTDKPKIS